MRLWFGRALLSGLSLAFPHVMAAITLLGRIPKDDSSCAYAEVRKVLVQVGDEWKLLNGSWMGSEEEHPSWIR